MAQNVFIIFSPLYFCLFTFTDWMADLRKKPRVDYKALANGPSIPSGSGGSETWSTKKLYKLTIKDTKIVDDVVKVFVHYIGWATKYDEWRNASDVLSIPDIYLVTNPGGREVFLEALKVAIKESLHGQRKVTSIIELRLPICRDLFEELAKYGSFHGSTLRCSVEDLKAILGNGWNLRIFNQHGDFAYVKDKTISLRLVERAPLLEYSINGEATYTHRGFTLVFKGQRGLGNRQDFNAGIHVV